MQKCLASKHPGWGRSCTGSQVGLLNNYAWVPPRCLPALQVSLGRFPPNHAPFTLQPLPQVTWICSYCYCVFVCFCLCCYMCLCAHYKYHSFWIFLLGVRSVHAHLLVLCLCLCMCSTIIPSRPIWPSQVDSQGGIWVCRWVEHTWPGWVMTSPLPNYHSGLLPGVKTKRPDKLQLCTLELSWE